MASSYKNACQELIIQDNSDSMLGFKCFQFMKSPSFKMHVILREMENILSCIISFTVTYVSWVILM